MAIASDNEFPKVIIKEGSAPATPASGDQSLFIDSSDHHLKRKNSGGSITDIEAGGGGGGTGDYILVQEQQAQNTPGGGFNSGAPRTRVMNNLVTNVGSHASLASNQITLAAGTYQVTGRCPAAVVDRHQAWLYNVTDSQVEVLGSSEYASVSGGGASDSIIEGRFTISGTKVFEVHHQCQTTNGTNGFGVEANFQTEIYTSVRFIKE